MLMSLKELKKCPAIIFQENSTSCMRLVRQFTKQVEIAETEKYPHVTFFFNGGKESPFRGEKRIMCPSPKVPTYDLKPEMSAFDIKDAIMPEINSNSADFLALSYLDLYRISKFGYQISMGETFDLRIEQA